jgi:hypothetical protein
MWLPAGGIDQVAGALQARVDRGSADLERAQLDHAAADNRSQGSQIWASWNPRRKNDAVDQFLRINPPADAVIVRANWRDNPWFPTELEAERKHDLEYYPERYPHIWEGEYAKAFEGAYFAKQLQLAKLEGRIARVGADPILPRKIFFDLGGTSARADALAMWVVQFVGREIRILDYIEGIGQESCAVIAALIDQPTTRLENRSMTAAT